MDTYHWDVLVTYHWDVFGCFIWDLFETSWRRTDGTSSLRFLQTLSWHTNKTSRRTTETSLGVLFETYLRSRWDIQRDVVTTSPRRLVAGWSSIEGNHSLTLVVYLFSSVSLQLQRKISSFIVKIFIEIGFKEVWVFQKVFLFVFGFLFTIIKTLDLLWWRKCSLKSEIRLCNLMTRFKGHVAVVKIYMVKFNVLILSRLEIMGFL